MYCSETEAPAPPHSSLLNLVCSPPHRTTKIDRVGLAVSRPSEAGRTSRASTVTTMLRSLETSSSSPAGLTQNGCVWRTLTEPVAPRSPTCAA